MTWYFVDPETNEKWTQADLEQPSSLKVKSYEYFAPSFERVNHYYAKALQEATSLKKEERRSLQKKYKLLASSISALVVLAVLVVFFSPSPAKASVEPAFVSFSYLEMGKALKGDNWEKVYYSGTPEDFLISGEKSVPSPFLLIKNVKYFDTKFCFVASVRSPKTPDAFKSDAPMSNASSSNTSSSLRKNRLFYTPSIWYAAQSPCPDLLDKKPL